MTAATTLDLHKPLKRYFGYDQFRTYQEEAIRTVLNGRDSLVLMPTGGGKSICYQLPALLQEGLTLVVSPLIALMRDQVEALKANGIPAAYLNSSLDMEAQRVVAQEVQSGAVKLLYVAPEKLLTSRFMDFLGRLRLALFAIDEAHCISAWGHDFRPEYAELAQVRERFPSTPIIALTATADKPTRQDIIRRLGMNDPGVFITSFNRPNIHLEVQPGKKRMERILDFVRRHPDTSGIVYCLSRKSTEQVAARLREAGFAAAHYHAGLEPEERNQVQRQFQRDETPIICATIAFGMGIDKPNIRWVIHYNLPKNMESYYQEIGRGGRDGLPTEAVLFYTFGDVVQLQRFIRESGQPELGMAKLERIQAYAEARVCRRRILLSYFGEHLEADCGHCDVCAAPPRTFDGTVLAQKALSALARLPEGVGFTMLIDVLRGSRRSELKAKGFDQIKTHGVGRDISGEDWQHYLLQMLHQGLIEIAYDEQHVLKRTEAATAVLKGQQTVAFVPPQPNARRQDEVAEAPPTRSKKQIREEALFEELRKLRKELAEAQGVPPFVVFGDAALQEMARQMPLTRADFGRISGVGEKKLAQYGVPFVKAIHQFIARRVAAGEQIPNGSAVYTWLLYQQGQDLAQMAHNRGMKETTLLGHMAKAHELGLGVKLSDFVCGEAVEEILAAQDAVGEQGQKAVFEHLDGRFDYGILRLVARLSTS